MDYIDIIQTHDIEFGDLTQVRSRFVILLSGMVADDSQSGL